MGIGTVTEALGLHHMIEALKSDFIVNKVGGRFKLTALIQRRLAQIIDGDRPLVERRGRTDLEVVIDEILQDKIAVDYDVPSADKPRSEPARRPRTRRTTVIED